jgi:hypothetical protein
MLFTVSLCERWPYSASSSLRAERSFIGRRYRPSDALFLERPIFDGIAERTPLSSRAIVWFAWE